MDFGSFCYSMSGVGGEMHKNYGFALVAALFAINVFWGASFVANTIALKSIGPIEIASLRFFIAAPLLFVITYIWKGREIFRFDKKDAGILVIMAITGVTLQYVLQVSAQDYTTATNASLLINTSVFFIMFLGAIFLDEKLTWWKVIGAIVGFAGVAVLLGNFTFNLSGHVVGDLMIIVCAFLWAVYSIYGKKIAAKYHPLTVLNYVFIIGTIGLIPFYLFTARSPLTSIPASAWASILFLSLFCSIIAYIIYNIALEKMEASRVAVYIYFVPLSTIVLAALLIHENITATTLGGGLMVLFGMYLAEMK
jgi:drug/metabolite transporter (DMT)-like permease